MNSWMARPAARSFVAVSLVVVIAAGSLAAVATLSAAPVGPRSERAATGQVRGQRFGKAATRGHHQSAATSGATVLQPSFAVLRRERTHADALSTAVLESIAPAVADRGMLDDQSRLLATTQTQTIWAVPDATGICLVIANPLTHGGQVLCNPASLAARQGVMTSSPTGVVGLLPDGSGPVSVRLVSGATLTVRADANGLVTSGITASPVSSYTYTGPGDQQYGSGGSASERASSSASAGVPLGN